MLERPAREPRTALLPGVRKLVPFIPVVAALGLLASLLEGAGIGLFIPLISLLLPGSVPVSVPGPIRSAAALFAGYDRETSALLLAIAIFALIVVKGVVQAANEYLAASVGGKVARELRNGLAETLLDLDYSFFLRHDAARLTQIVATDNWFVLDAVHSALALIPAVAGLLVFGGLLAWLNLKLFAIVAVGALLLQTGLYFVTRRQEQLSRKFTDSYHLLWDRLLTLVQAPRVIRMFGQQQREEQRTAAAVEQLRRTVTASQRLNAFVNPCIDATISLLFLFVLLAGYWSGMSVPTITAFLLLLIRAQPHAKTIGTARLGIATFHGSMREVRWLLSQRPAPFPAAAAAEVRFDRPITLDDICYSYPNGSIALDRVSVTIPPGQTTAILGDSGSGKTTLVNILSKLLEPQSGQIWLGEDRADSISPDQWRKCIALAGQDSELIAGTVAENIAYGRPDASMQEVEEAAKIAGADKFIRTLPQGYATRLGTQGLTLSGGQRQRVGLARAILTKPDLLMLDEATNAVDALAESEIMKLIVERRYFHTMVVISHRKSTVAGCQNGIVLDHGQVIEQGRLADLDYFRTRAGRSAEAADV